MTDQTVSDQTAAQKRTHLVFGIMLSGFMAFTFAGMMPLMALGFTVEWLFAWGSGFLLGWTLGFVLVSLINQPLMRLACRLTQ